MDQVPILHLYAHISWWSVRESNSSFGHRISPNLRLLLAPDSLRFQHLSHNLVRKFGRRLSPLAALLSLFLSLLFKALLPSRFSISFAFSLVFIATMVSYSEKRSTSNESLTANRRQRRKRLWYGYGSALVLNCLHETRQWLTILVPM